MVKQSPAAGFLSGWRPLGLGCPGDGGRDAVTWREGPGCGGGSLPPEVRDRGDPRQGAAPPAAVRGLASVPGSAVPRPGASRACPPFIPHRSRLPPAVLREPEGDDPPPPPPPLSGPGTATAVAELRLGAPRPLGGRGRGAAPRTLFSPAEGYGGRRYGERIGAP